MFPPHGEEDPAKMAVPDRVSVVVFEVTEEGFDVVLGFREGLEEDGDLVGGRGQDYERLGGEGWSYRRSMVENYITHRVKEWKRRKGRRSGVGTSARKTSAQAAIRLRKNRRQFTGFWVERLLSIWRAVSEPNSRSATDRIENRQAEERQVIRRRERFYEEGWI